MENRIIVGKWEQLKIQTISNLSQGKIQYHEAMALVNKSERTIRRWLREFEQKGLSFIRHGNKGRAPINRTDVKFRNLMMDYVQTELYDFNMLHALEKIELYHGVKIPRETFRRWCHEFKVVKLAHSRRRSRPRFKRPRFSQAGFMLQLDGSPHRWFNNEENCLLAIIDDATSFVLGGLFTPTETMFGTFQLLTTVFEKYGLPSIIYVDRAGIYGGQKRTNFSQLVRALEELGVQIIYANSPQGKGRIERLFRTLQDRLIPEMRQAEVNSLYEATKYFNEIYLPHLHNSRFSVQAENLTPAWRPLAFNQKLEDIFCIKEYRKVANDHTFSYEGQKYLIISPIRQSIANHDIEVRINSKNEILAKFAGKSLDFKLIQKGPIRGVG